MKGSGLEEGMRGREVARDGTGGRKISEGRMREWLQVEEELQKGFGRRGERKRGR